MEFWIVTIVLKYELYDGIEKPISSFFAMDSY
jgi:hypothetical protein